MRDVYVLGIDMMKFGRFPERTVPQLGAAAALLALDDAGFVLQDMQALYCGNIGESGAMVGQRILHQIGQTGVPVVNCTNACATGATAFREAWMSIQAGLYDLVLAVGVEQMGRGLLGGGSKGGISTEGLLGSTTMPAVFAEAGLEHTRNYGTSFEQFAKVSVKNHHHATLNPKAMYQLETPLEILMSELPRERTMIAVCAQAAAEAAFDWTVSYVKERTAFGQPLAALQNTRFKLAELRTELDVGRAFLDRCVNELAAGRLDATQAAKAKYWLTELQGRACDLGVQLHGGYGYMAEYPIARAWTDARVQRIYGGANEVMLELVARSFLGR